MGYIYFKLGEATSALAANKNRERLQEARSLFQRSRDIWQALADRGLLAGDFAKMFEEAARAIVRCDTTLAKIKAR